MGFEALPASDVPSGGDFSSFASSVRPPQQQTPQFVNGTTPNATSTPTAVATGTGVPSNTPVVAPSNTPTVVPTSAPPAAGPGLSAQTGQWVNVTPANVNLSSALDCGNYGTQTVAADPARPSNLYAQFNCQGIWKSTDYGQTWTGPINTGPGGAAAGDAAGGIAIARGAGSNPPILYSAGIRGSGMGFWRSLDGGASWTNFPVSPGGSRQDWYPPTVDPYDANHLIMAAHEQNLLAQSTDGGQTWTSIPMAGGMNENGGTAFLFFINTGTASSTRNTWLYMAQGTGGVVGTWRTSNAGASWTRVDSNEHPHGNAQIYQPDTSGVVYMAGVYSAGGWGVERSTDYGQTWTHVGNSASEAIVFGTPNRVYSMYGWACGMGCNVPPNWESAAQPGASGWSGGSTPAGMTQGPGQAAVVFNGSQYVIVTANWTVGLWRYIDPGSGGPGPAVATNTPTPIATSTQPPVSTSTPTPRPTNIPTQVATATATPNQQPGYTATAQVSSATVVRGSAESITTSVKATTNSTVLVDVEVYDSSGKKVFQQYWDNQSFTSGQTRTYGSSWQIPTTALPGTYTVKVGIFSTGWSGTLYYWNDNAATFKAM